MKCSALFKIWVQQRYFNVFGKLHFHVIIPQIPFRKVPKLFLVWCTIKCKGASKRLAKAKHGFDIHKTFSVLFVRLLHSCHLTLANFFSIALFWTFFILFLKILSQAIRIKSVHRRIQNPIIHLIWSFLQKKLTSEYR